MKTVTDPKAVQAWALTEKRAGRTIGFVPTMGFLHEGHLSLVRRARAENANVVVSIFVNPLQFGPTEDLAVYPRDAGGDAAKVEGAGCDVLFMPEPSAMYAEGFQTHVDVSRLSQGMCGAHRPGHFRGVATVVAKLFNLIQPDRAYFGDKDYQQVQVIRQMVEDLAFPLAVIALPTVRDADGLAMSSRNVRLSDRARQAALILPEALKMLQARCRRETLLSTTIREEFKAVLARQPEVELEYVEIVEPQTLSALTQAGGRVSAVLAAAIRVGGVRLIDHCRLGD